MDEENAAIAAAYKNALRQDPCAYCGCSGGSLDRIVPGHRGGSYCWLNTIGVCQSCNSSKGTRSILGHLLRLYVALDHQRRTDEVARSDSIWAVIRVHDEVVHEQRLLAAVGR